MQGDQEIAACEGTLVAPATGCRLHYRTWEGTERQRSIVLIHGLASTLRIWDFVAPILASTFLVAAYDQRGHAGSDKPGSGYDLDTELADLRGLIEELRLDRPIVVGHSWGATIALAYTARYREECSGVALVDGGVLDLSGRPDATWENVSRELAPPVLSHLTLEDLVERSGRGQLEDVPEEFRREYFRSMMEEQPDGTIRARLSRENHMKILRTMWETHAAGLMKEVKCPALLVMAASDAEDGSREEQFMQLKRQGVAQAEKLLARKKVVWMDDTIHDIPLHRPEWLAGEILSFFS